MSVFLNFYDPKEVKRVLNQDTDCLAELKQTKIWVCFIITESDGKTNKTPISAHGTETGTDAAHAHTWVTYDEAVKAMQACEKILTFLADDGNVLYLKGSAMMTTLENFWYGNIQPFDMDIIPGSQYEKASKRKARCEDALLAVLTDEQKVLYNKLSDAQSEQSSLGEGIIPPGLFSWRKDDHRGLWGKIGLETIETIRND